MRLRFLIDECTGRRLAILIKESGYDVIFVGDWKPSATDEDVLRKAEEEHRILITDDKVGKTVKRSDTLKSINDRSGEEISVAGKNFEIS